MNVVDMGARPPRKTAPTLVSVFGTKEGTYIEWCALWRVLRAQQELNWAKYHLASGFGTLPDEGIKLSIDPLQRMKEIEDHLAEVTPKTALLAQEMLGMCVTILTGSSVESRAGSCTGDRQERESRARLAPCRNAASKSGPRVINEDAWITLQPTMETTDPHPVKDDCQ